MNLKVGENEYELSTKLGTAVAIEKKFNVPIMQLFGKLSDATTNDLIELIVIAAKKTSDANFRSEMLEVFDYLDLFLVVQELISKLMFSGTADQNEAKLAKAPMAEDQKNGIRVLMGMPIPTAPETSTGNE